MEGIELLRQKRGTIANLAKCLGISRSAISMWVRVPAERVIEVERATGISREQLRPDLYRSIPVDTAA
jgi:DNA-binding transcriptional regulator YdaS (Cro superfamily)